MVEQLSGALGVLVLGQHLVAGGDHLAHRGEVAAATGKGIPDEGPHGDERGTERTFPFDPFPRIITASEWEKTSEGLKQRLQALNCFINDVYNDGKITYNQKEVSLLKLHDELRALKKNNGTVWYYREDGEDEPHPQAANVIQAVIGAGLPISLSSKPDFSTVVLPDGTIKPRKQPIGK